MFHTSGLNFSPFRMTRFSRQLVPERASCSLSAKVDSETERRRRDQNERTLGGGGGCGAVWQTPPTLPDAPLQLREDVGQQDLAEGLVELSEDVADGVEGVVTRGGHPLGFLKAGRQKQSERESTF